MDYDKDKVDEMVLALLHLTSFKERNGPVRTWKGQDWEVMARLHEKRYIADPVGKAKSVVMSREGAALAEKLFEKHFGRTGE